MSGQMRKAVIEELREFVDKELRELGIDRDKNLPGGSRTADVNRVEEEIKINLVVKDEDEKNLTTFQNLRPSTSPKVKVVAEDSVISINKKEALGLYNGCSFIIFAYIFSRFSYSQHPG